MSWISTQFVRYWRHIHIATICILSIVLIFGPQPVRDGVQRAVQNVIYYPAFKITTTLDLLQSRAKDNAELQESLAKTSHLIMMYEEALRENKRLREALGFESPPGYSLVPAEVMSLSGYELPVSAIINLGRADSVLVNQPVINQNGVIGRISEVNEQYSTVQLLTDPANRIAARVASSREMGIVKYDVSDGLTLDNFPLNGSIVVGDTIISSGLGGVYPAGLLVGFVTDVVRDENMAFCQVKLQPAANFYSIEELFILRVNSGL
jgi:rod shape-determining protein MreC